MVEGHGMVNTRCKHQANEVRKCSCKWAWLLDLGLLDMAGCARVVGYFLYDLHAHAHAHPVGPGPIVRGYKTEVRDRGGQVRS